MSCIITYKGKKYSEEQFKEYFINNKQEFATPIAKNKDVIDSFKRKMEGIDYVFSQSPELASIGSKAQYLQYLSTIFKTSKVKDIVYHGTKTKFDKFDISKSGENLASWSETKKSINFTNVKNVAENYAEAFSTGENMLELIADDFNRNPERINADGTVNKKEVEKQLLENNPNKIRRAFKTDENGDFILKDGSKQWEKERPFTNKEWNEIIDNASKRYQEDYNLLTNWSNNVISAVVNIKNPTLFDAKGKGKTEDFFNVLNNSKGDGFIANNLDDWGISNNIRVFEPEQIHILGSKQDIENFKKFVGQPINKEIKPKIDSSKKIEDFTNHSGGAIGADSMFDKIGRELGFNNHNHYWANSKTPLGNKELTKEQLVEGVIHAKAAAKELGRPWIDKYANLLGRNWFQVKNSTQVIAIAPIVHPNETNSKGYKVKALRDTVDGGTGYAVEMGIANGKEVNVFNTKDNQWYKWNGTTFEKSETPILHKDFAGIGSRQDNGKMTPESIQAIKDVYEKTLQTQEQPIVEETKENFNNLSEYTNEEKKKILTTFASKYNISEQQALDDINKALKENKQGTIDNLNECF